MLFLAIRKATNPQIVWHTVFIHTKIITYLWYKKNTTDSAVRTSWHLWWEIFRVWILWSKHEYNQSDLAYDFRYFITRQLCGGSACDFFICMHRWPNFIKKSHSQSTLVASWTRKVLTSCFATDLEWWRRLKWLFSDFYFIKWPTSNHLAREKKKSRRMWQ